MFQIPQNFTLYFSFADRFFANAHVNSNMFASTFNLIRITM